MDAQRERRARGPEDDLLRRERARACATPTERGAGEAIFPNTQGNLCEATGSNVFLVDDGVLRHPARVGRVPARRDPRAPARARAELGDPVRGARRRRSAPCVQADEAFLSSTTREVQPIAHVDGDRAARRPRTRQRPARGRVPRLSSGPTPTPDSSAPSCVDTGISWGGGGRRRRRSIDAAVDDEVALVGQPGRDAFERPRGRARRGRADRASPTRAAASATTRRRGAVEPRVVGEQPARRGVRRDRPRSHGRDVAQLGGKRTRARTLQPMPTTTAPAPSASARMPASLRSSTTTIVRPLQPRVGPASTAIASRPRPRPPASRDACARTATRGASSTETSSAAPGGATHDRPSRPRPAVCSSATATTPSAAPAAACSSR